jgi:hypothetical protein
MSFMASHIQNTDLHHETIVFQEKKPATQMSEKKRYRTESEVDTDEDDSPTTPDNTHECLPNQEKNYSGKGKKTAKTRTCIVPFEHCKVIKDPPQGVYIFIGSRKFHICNLSHFNSDSIRTNIIRKLYDYSKEVEQQISSIQQELTSKCESSGCGVGCTSSFLVSFFSSSQ